MNLTAFTHKSQSYSPTNSKQAEDEEDEDWGLPPELKRMVEQEDKEVKPHQEETKIVNLGVGEERKEVKVGTGMSMNIRDELVALL